MKTAGLDIGSLTAKAVILENGEILATSLVMTGHSSKLAGERAMDEALKAVGLSREEIGLLVATGYGRLSVDFADDCVTEITCHARGASFTHPETRTVIDLGGQDSKAIALNETGRVREFVMNEKCAAGTGRFLEVMADALEVGLEQLGRISLTAREPAKISSVCTVFAESEVVSRVAEGAGKADIVAGIHEAIASRIYAMSRRIPVEERIMLSGGVAKNVGVVKALEKRFNTGLLVPEMPQHVGALGAALLAESRLREPRGVI